MDTIGINWQYILHQIVNFIILLGFSGIFLISVVFVLRAQRPAFLSKHVSDLTATSDGLFIPNEYLERSDKYELRKFGKAVIVISQE